MSPYSSAEAVYANDTPGSESVLFGNISKLYFENAASDSGDLLSVLASFAAQVDILDAFPTLSV